VESLSPLAIFLWIASKKLPTLLNRPFRVMITLVLVRRSGLLPLKQNMRYVKMTLTFTKSELAKTLSVLSPYFTKGCPMTLRIVKGGVLDMFVTSTITGGSVLAHVPCNKTEKATSWMHVDGPTFQNLVTLADEGPIMIEIGKDELTLKYAPSSTSQLRLLDGPSFESGVKFGSPSATVTGGDLNTLVSMTEAASTDEARPNLHGIYIAATKKKLEAAAADGFILSFVSLKLKDDLDASGAMYAVKALGRAKRAIKAADDEEVRIGFHAGGIALSITRDNAEYLFDVPKMEGSFPDYKAIVKSVAEAIKVEVETNALASFLKRASAINGNVFVQAVGGFLWLMAQNAETKEQSVDSIPIAGKGDSVCMYYVSGLLKDTLKACVPNGKIVLTFPEGNKSPMLFEGAAGVVAMPLVNPLTESPFKGRQPALI
jgi:DNA polymerase III sliding clamp (beta) subunit (PCNA family)